MSVGANTWDNNDGENFRIQLRGCSKPTKIGKSTNDKFLPIFGFTQVRSFILAQSSARGNDSIVYKVALRASSCLPGTR